jgi:predicted alpha/beta-fold hydrolase
MSTVVQDHDAPGDGRHCRFHVVVPMERGAVAEALNSTLKVEYIHRQHFRTRAEARVKIATWIVDFYNTRRRHSACQGMSPIDTRDQQLRPPLPKTTPHRGRLHDARGLTGPAVVCVHGLGGSHANWHDLGPLLAKHRRVIAVDLAGHGRTPRAGRSASVSANVGLLARFLEDVVEGPAVVVGNSMGAGIAVLLAAARPAAVRGLC